MAIPTTREEFKNYILRKLGQPVIEVNVAQEQLDDRIDEGLYLFYERYFDGVEEFYMMYQVTEEDVERGYIQFDSDVVAISDVAKARIAMGLGALEYQTVINNVLNFTSSFNIGNNFQYYINAQAYLTLLNRYFSPDRTFSFNRNSGSLIMKIGDLKQSHLREPGIIIKGYRKVKTEEDSNDDRQISNIWQVKWLQEYCTALVREQWGQNLGKYVSIEILGGVTINGEEMTSLARDDLRRLEQELIDMFQAPPIFYWG